MSGQQDDRRRSSAPRRSDTGSAETALDRALIARLHRVGASIDRAPDTLRARIATLLDRALDEPHESRE